MRTRTPKSNKPERSRGESHESGGRFAGAVTFLTGALVVGYLFWTNPDPKTFEAYTLVNSGLCFWAPLMMILFVMRQEPAQFGLTRGDNRLGMKWVLFSWIVMVLPLVYASHQPVFATYYKSRLSWPLSGVGSVFDQISKHVNLKALLYYELCMGFYMFCWEFFFRGFLLFGLLKTRLNVWEAVILQALPFMLLHWSWNQAASKPGIEVYSSLAGGLALGVLAVRTRSFLYGFLAHWAISITNDLFIITPFIFPHLG